MRASIRRSLTRPVAGPLPALLALALAGGLAGALAQATRTEAALKAQVAELKAQNRDAALMWQAKLSTCHAQAATPAPLPSGGRLTPVAEDGDTVAGRLASVGPAGFDDCARMEAADAAVLNSLRAK